MLCRSRVVLLVAAVLLTVLISVTQPVHGAASSLTNTNTTTTGAALDIPLLRGIAYDRRTSATRGSNLGTRGALLRGRLVLYKNDAGAIHPVSGRLETSARRKYKARTVYVPCATHILSTQLAQLLEFGVHGFIFELCAEDAHNERIVAAFLAHEETDVPVYFVQDRTAASELFALLQRLDRDAASKDALADQLRISVGADARAVELKLNASLQAYTIVSQMHYRLREFRRATRQRPAPSVLLTANVDTMGVAPLATTTSGASGAIAAMELWRRLVSSAAMRGTDHTGKASSTTNNHEASSLQQQQFPYGLTMLLGSTARVNYAGTTSWLAGQKDVDMELYKMVISLDELLPLPTSSTNTAADNANNDEAFEMESEGRGRGGRMRRGTTNTINSTSFSTSGDVLYMHVRDTFGRGPDEKRLEQLALSAAEATGVALQIVPARTNFHHYELRFEHEVFVNRQVPAATFSSSRMQKQDQIFRDVSRAVTPQDTAVLLQRIEFLHRFLQLLLNITDEEEVIDASSEGTDAQEKQQRVTRWTGAGTYINGLLTHASRSPRSLLSLHNRANHSLEEYMTGLEQHMRQHNSLARGTLVTAASALRTEDIVPTAIRFYAPYEERMKVYVARSSWKEFAVMLLVASALAGFAYAEFGVTGMKALVFS